MNEAHLYAEAARLEVARMRSGIGAAGAGGGGNLAELMQNLVGGIGAGVAGATAFNGRARLADAVKGVTGGGNGAVISQQLAYGDTIPQRQLDAAEASRDILAQNLPSAARDLNIIAAGRRVS